MTVLIYFAFISFLIFVDTKSICEVKKIGIINQYPSNTNYKYAISFNRTLIQPNYVYYISTKGGNSVKNKAFIVDPYGINPMRTTDYTNSGYDRGHLVPNADYGKDTYYITNAVPMVPKFNRGVWAKHEDYLRKLYYGYLIVKGCEYDLNEKITSHNHKSFYIPLGCYYIVFDIITLPSIYDTIKGKVLEYGYFENKDDSIQMDYMPHWLDCENNHPKRNINQYNIKHIKTCNSPTFQTSKDVSFIKYYAPGEYTLNPINYNHKNKLLVEMWSAGAGGSPCPGKGGGSGSYIKFYVNTFQKPFNINVGRGGIGGITSDCNRKNFEEVDGESSSFISRYDRTINVTLSGGTHEGNRYPIDNGGKIISEKGIYTLYKQNGQNSYPYFCIGQCDCIYRRGKLIAGFGGNAPFGGYGGHASSFTSSNQQHGYSDYECSPYHHNINECINRIRYNNDFILHGQTPGGGGRGTFYSEYGCQCSTDGCSTGVAGNGGNGTVIIYF